MKAFSYFSPSKMDEAVHNSGAYFFAPGSARRSLIRCKTPGNSSGPTILAHVAADSESLMGGSVRHLTCSDHCSTMASVSCWRVAAGRVLVAVLLTLAMPAPWEAFYVWQGGMSFHGGAIGMLIGTYFFARGQGLNWVAFGDRAVCVVPIGLFCGRIANFINGELWGRVSDVPWAMVFPTGGPEPRHPSQLYQAGLEGIALFVVLMVLAARPAVRARAGMLSGVFFAGYGIARIIGEFFRQPDAHLGFLFAGATMGQLLSLPMVIGGAWLIWRAKPFVEAAPARA